jgi:AcrR family transcriptional regulator
MRDGTKTKEVITATALRLFVEKGITETTIRDIAGAAGVAEGTLYRHYDSKDALAWDLFSTNYLAFARELDQAQAEQATVKAKLEAMIHKFCRFFDDDPVMFSYLLLSQHAQLKKVTSQMTTPVSVLVEVMAAGMGRGEITGHDPQVAAAMVLGVVLEVAVFRVYGRIESSLVELADALTRACWRVLER